MSIGPGYTKGVQTAFYNEGRNLYAQGAAGVAPTTPRIKQSDAIGSPHAVSSESVVMNSSVLVGNPLVVMVGLAGAGAVTGVTDTLGNTYVARQGTAQAANCRVDIWECVSAFSGPNTITATFANTFAAMIVFEISFMATAAYDTGAVGSGTTTGNPPTGNFTPAGAGDVVVAAFAFFEPPVGWLPTPGAGFGSFIVTQDSGPAPVGDQCNIMLAAECDLVAGAGAQTATVSTPLLPNVPYAGAAIAMLV